LRNVLHSGNAIKLHWVNMEAQNKEADMTTRSRPVKGYKGGQVVNKVIIVCWNSQIPEK
jgi:hypothetical protein